MKKIYMTLTVLIMICTIGMTVGCNNINSSESSESEQVVTEVTQFQPSLSENEARMRAGDAIKDKFDSISPSLSGPYDEFSSWGGVVASPEITYNKNTDSYTAQYSDGSCGIRYTFMGVNQIAGYKANFDATVTIYSNGDTHIDNFNYDIISEK